MKDAIEDGTWGVLLGWAEEYASIIYGRDGRKVTVKEAVERMIPLFPEENPHRVRGELALQYKGDERFTMDPSDQVEGLTYLMASMIEDGNEDAINKDNDPKIANAVEILKGRAKERIEEEATGPVQQGFLYKGSGPSEQTICPRCMGDINIESMFADYHSSPQLSRYRVPDENGELVRAIKICCLCEEDEAWVQFHHQGDIIPPHKWPIERQYCTQEFQHQEYNAQCALDDFRYTETGQEILKRWELDDESVWARAAANREEEGKDA